MLKVYRQTEDRHKLNGCKSKLKIKIVLSYLFLDSNCTISSLWAVLVSKLKFISVGLLAWKIKSTIYRQLSSKTVNKLFLTLLKIRNEIFPCQFKLKVSRSAILLLLINYIRDLWYNGSKIKKTAAKIDWNSNTQNHTYDRIVQ